MVSIIVLCWNHLDDVTKPFVENILSVTKDVDFELILVDNGSNDGTDSYIKSLNDPRVKPIISKKNLGFSGGNNLGYKYAKGDYICFLNNDVVFHNPNWLKELLQNQEENTLIGPHLVNSNSLTSFNNLPVPYLNGWCIFGAKKIFEDIKENGKVFDERFNPAYFEDVELCFRAAIKGYKLKEVSNIELEHLGSRSSNNQLNINLQTKKAKRLYDSKLVFLDLKARKTKRIVFYCAGVNYEFNDLSYEGKGVGGAEASLILLSRELVKLGYQVEIYNNNRVTGNFGGVSYKNVSQFLPYLYCDIFVLFRSYTQKLPYVNAIHKIFWSCDQYTDQIGIWDHFLFPEIDGVIAISPYHEKYLVENYKIHKDKIKVLELGVNLVDYEKLLEKQEGKVIWCSVPQRGLDRLAKLAPEIKSRFPKFELFITSDYRLWGLDWPNNQEYVDLFKDKEYVHFLGKIPRKELVHHQLTSEVMAYTCTYEECFCIAAMECIAAGAIPVTIDIGAMSSTVGSSGIVLSNINEEEKYVNSVVELLTKKEKRLALEKEGKERSKNYSWSKVAQNWLSYFKELEQAKKEIKMVECLNCHLRFENSFLLSEHKAENHVTEITKDEPVIPDIPQYTIIRTSKYVEVQINGAKYIGTELKVPFEHVPSVCDTIANAYGKDTLL